MSHEPAAATALDGTPVYVHDSARDWAPAQGVRHHDEILAHVDRWLGTHAGVFAEQVTDQVRLDLVVVAPSEDVPCWRIVTSGMSDLPMQLPDGADADVPRHLELVITLPGDWNLQDLHDERHYWPLRLLKFLGRLPHRYATFLGYGHTVPNGDPAQPYAHGLGFDGAILLAPSSIADGFARLRTEDGLDIHFLAVVPLYPQEMALKLREGDRALLARFDQHHLDDLVDPGRRNVAKKRFGLF